MTTPPASDVVWRELSGDLWRFLRRRVADDHQADDLLQETFLRIHRGLDALDDAQRVAPWVYRIARNVLVDHYRRAADALATLGDADPVAEENPRETLPGQAAGWLAELIAQLPEPYRAAVRLSEVEGETQAEVARRLGLSPSGAKSRVQRGRKLLRASLERCCTFHYDRRGNLLDCIPKPHRTACRDCES